MRIFGRDTVEVVKRDFGPRLNLYTRCVIDISEAQDHKIHHMTMVSDHLIKEERVSSPRLPG